MNINVRIVELELMNSSPDRVYEYLRKIGEQYGRTNTPLLDKGIEKNLLSRSNKLITLGLALYCVDSETLADIFFEARNNNDEVIKLACISNTAVVRFGYSDMPEGLFRRNEAEQFKWFKEATEAEIEALFKNPTINSSFLAEYLEGNKYWESIDDNRRLLSVKSLYFNERMGQISDILNDNFFSVFHAVWKLTKTVPVNNLWASTLSSLLGIIQQKITSEYFLKVAKRWVVQDNEEESERYFLNPYEEIRACIYRNFIQDKYSCKINLVF